MKKSKTVSAVLLGLTLTWILSSSGAQAGGATSGGGKAVLCDRLEILDLYEGNIRYGLNYRPSEGSLLENYRAATIRYREMRGDQRGWTDEDTTAFDFLLKNQVHFIAPGERLPVLNDTGSVELEAGCSLLQIAVYDDLSGSLSIDPVLWEQLTPRSQAALLMHETLWARSRAGGLPVSVLSRLQTALTFSESTLPHLSISKARETTQCWATRAGAPASTGAGATYSLAFWAEEDHTVIQVLKLAGTVLVSDSRFVLPVTGLTLSQDPGPVRVAQINQPFAGELAASQGELALPGSDIRLHVDVHAGQQLMIGAWMPGFSESLAITGCRGQALIQ